MTSPPAMSGLARTLPYPWLIPVAVLLALAPFARQPHLLEKLRMLFAGALRRPIDIFDLVLHGTPTVLLVLRASLDARAWLQRRRNPTS